MTKILYVANIRLPTERAHGLQIMETCAAFTKGTVELVIPTRDNQIIEDPFTHYHITESFTVTKVAVPDFVRFGRIGFLISALWFAEKARWLKQFWEAEIIYSRDAFVLFQYLLLGRTLVFEAHAKPTFISRIVARRAHQVVVISQGLRMAYERVKVHPSRIIVAPDAVRPELFESVPPREKARTALGLKPDVPVVLYAGHLYTRKGVHTLAEAAHSLAGTEVVFVGGTIHDVTVFKERWKGTSNIHIIGHLTHDIIPLYLRAATVLVLPNSAKDEDSAYFTSPMKLFEYMASGTPIVASDVPALREVLTEESAYFFTPDDPVSLAESITHVLSHDTEASHKAKHAELEVARYTWESRARRIEEGIAVPRERKDTHFFNTQSNVYSARRYPVIPLTFTQFFFKERLRAVLTLLMPVLGRGEPKAVLEVGCADGVVARAVWEEYHAHIASFEANDIAPHMIETAKQEHGDTPIQFSLRTGEPLVGTYHTVIEVGVLNYTDTAVDFAQIARVLAPEGRYICSLSATSSLQNRLKGATGYAHLLSYAEYEKEMCRYFRIEAVQPVGFFVPHLWKWPWLARRVQPLLELIGAVLVPSWAHEKVYTLALSHV